MNLIFLFGLIGIVSSSEKNATATFHRVTHVAWFEITTGSIMLGRIEIGLFGRVVPMTVRNFVTLTNRPRNRGYKGSIIHSVNKFYIGGGDWVSGNGRGGRSSFETPWFDDENFKIKHYGAGWVSSCGDGKDSQTSLFIITLQELSKLNGVCVVFGKIIRGMNVIRRIARIPMTREGRLKTDLIISDCGAAPVDPPFYTPNTDATD